MSEIIHNPHAQADNRTAADLAAVMPTGMTVQDGRLALHGSLLSDLADDYGTALYVIDIDEVLQNLRDYQLALANDGYRAHVAYAGKAFICKELCRLLEQEGSSLDVSSGGELALALSAGFNAQRCVEHGNNKTEQELTEAIEAGVGLIVADSLEELERINRIAKAQSRRQAILLRIKPGVVADTHSFITTGGEDSKFGLGIHDGQAAEGIKAALALPNVELRGLHVHIGSQIFNLEGFAAAIQAVYDFMAEQAAQTGWQPQALDLGGGLGIAYTAADQPTSIADFGAFIQAQLAQAAERTGIYIQDLYVEPGRSIVCRAGITLYRVGTIKHLPGICTYVAVDGGMSDNIRYPLYGATYESLLVDKASQPRSQVLSIVGKHCESGDILALDASLQEPQVGDVLCMLATGAYTYSMSSNYNKQPRPGVLFVSSGAVGYTEKLVVRRETYADLYRCDL